MLNLFKKKPLKLYALCKAFIKDLSAVPDSAFSQHLIGDGLAFELLDDVLYAPCDGEIIMLQASKHACGILADNGAKILIHCGLDTYSLQGEGLENTVQLKQYVHRGDPLLKIDRKLMQERKIDLLTVMVITNKEDYAVSVEAQAGSRVDLNTEVLRVSKIRSS